VLDLYRAMLFLGLGAGGMDLRLYFHQDTDHGRRASDEPEPRINMR
jgi:hypothetical protein